MPDLAPSYLALIAAVTFIAAIIGGMGGFGTGIMLTAVLTPILGIKAVVPILAFAGIIINAGRFWFYRRDVTWSAVKRILPVALVCLLIGTQLYRSLPPGPLAIAIGFVVLAAVPLRRWLASRDLRLGPAGLTAGGAAFGFLNGVASGMGIVLVSVLLGAGLSGTAVLATDALITIVVDLARAAIFGRMALLTEQGLALGVLIGLVSLPGSWVASRIVKRLGKRLHIVFIELLILLGGLSLVVNGWRNLA
ncbi:MAG: sulfite exporter TauE/SafE family protein [Betaproteobacteria bacterium]|nr:sulfite exporter TauE/SafE family protein [Betaproteobacteria bacterium]